MQFLKNIRLLCEINFHHFFFIFLNLKLIHLYKESG